MVFYKSQSRKIYITKIYFFNFIIIVNNTHTQKNIFSVRRFKLSEVIPTQREIIIVVLNPELCRCIGGKRRTNLSCTHHNIFIKPNTEVVL